MSKAGIFRRLDILEGPGTDQRFLVVICDNSGTEPLYSGACWTEEDRALNRQLSKTEFNKWLEEKSKDRDNQIFILSIFKNAPEKEFKVKLENSHDENIQDLLRQYSEIIQEETARRESQQ